MAGLMPGGGSPSTRDVQPARPAPTREDPEVVARQQREAAAAQRQRGRTATMLTGGTGTTEVQPTVARQLLLGS